MKFPASLLSVCLALGAAAMASHGSLVEAQPLHAGVDYDRYLLQVVNITGELSSWMAKWKDAAGKNGLIPPPTAPNATEEQTQEDYRQRFFMATLLVERLNLEHPQAQFSTDSPFTLLTSEEFAKYVKNSYIVGGGSTRQLRVEPDESSRVLQPAARSLDWTTGNCMPPIQDQGQCGSCWAFASVAAVETSQCIAHGGNAYTKYSEQTLTSCDTKVDAGCNGGVPQYALDYVKSNGVCTLAADPYTSGNGAVAACNTGCSRVQTGLQSVVALARNEPALISALNQHPVVVAVQSGNDAWKQYQSGIISSCPDPSVEIDHAVLAVGYDGSSIKIRNSWSAYWGENGYVRLARSTSGLGTCRILEQMVHVTF